MNILSLENLLRIRKASAYLQDILTDTHEINKNINKLLNQIYIVDFKKEFKCGHLFISYEFFINCILKLLCDYKNIRYSGNSIVLYAKLVDYLQLNIKHEFFNYIVDLYIFDENVLYDKIYPCNAINLCILDKFSKENDINNETFRYIFDINNDICNEIKILNSKYISQNLLNRCKNIVSLDISNNRKITNVNHLEFLDELNVYGFCGINKKYLSEFCVMHLNKINNSKKIYLL